MTCKADESNNTRAVQTNANISPIVASAPLTVAQATTAGPRCSASCRSVDCRSKTCKIDESISLVRHRNVAYRFSSSQDHKRRQLAHGVRNRAGQLIVVQEPAKATKTAISRVTHRNDKNTSPIVASFPAHKY
jgi:hypothetical protein